jgi:hypothetical protein
MPTWVFKKLSPGDTTREPIQGEFFSTEAITDNAEALVREGIQNSLDARSGAEPVLVRIRVSGAEHALPAHTVAPFLDGIWDHLHARGNGLRQAPAPNDPCGYLVFEDFGTTGLQGDPTQWHRKDGAKNGFFTFFRAEGHSDKGETDRGRWGVGKTVFPRSSRISSFWGVTVRAADSRRFLMGRAILKTHQFSGVRHVPDGYFGIPGDDNLMLPVEDGATIDRFCKAFGLHREAEPGLSLVVPWCDPEEMSLDALLQAAVKGYFYPILAGALTIELSGTGARPHLLGADTLLDTVRRLNGKLATDMMPFLELAVWARDVSRQPLTTLNPPPVRGALHWLPELLPEDTARQLRLKLQAGERIAIRVPFPVREQGTPLRWSHFDVFLVRDGTEKRGRPIFVREGIIIPDVRGRTTRGIRSLVIADDKPIATMLGDSENPAHTEWQKDGSNYKNKYVFGPSNLAFVADSVAEIVRMITVADEEADPSILIDLFSLPQVAGAAKTREKRAQPENKGQDTPDGMDDFPAPKPRGFRVQRIAAGFRVTRGDPAASPPALLEIKAAYDIRQGNPLKKYQKVDFQLDRAPIQIDDDLEGIEVVSRALNEMVVRVLKPDFRLSVTGFDPNRDLYVKVLPREEEADGD